jgi:carboxypeptidase family protein
LTARGILNSEIDRKWLIRIATVLLSCGAMVNAQSATPAGTDTSQTAVKGNIVGTILDQSGSVAAGAAVRLTSEDKSFSQEVVSGDNGQYSFSNVPPGRFDLSVNSAGFGGRAFTAEVAPGQTYLVPPIVLSVATVVTGVKVTVDPVEVATEEVKEQEHQRVLGFIPNFYVTYHADAPPLTTKLKFKLAWKSSTDPVNIFGTAFFAGLQQAGDEYHLDKARRAMASATGQLTRTWLHLRFFRGRFFRLC